MDTVLLFHIFDSLFNLTISTDLYTFSCLHQEFLRSLLGRGDEFLDLFLGVGGAGNLINNNLTSISPVNKDSTDNNNNNNTLSPENKIDQENIFIE
jgi:hypothetical protein